MQAAELLEQRREQWSTLEMLCRRMERGSRRRLQPETLNQFASLYRSACSDLALADAYHLPPGTVDYLHQLVGRAHNQLYRSSGFRLGTWWRELMFEVPQRLFADNALRLAFVVFWGTMFVAGWLAYSSADFRQQVLGEDFMTMLEQMHADSATGRSANDAASMTGFYIRNNTGIGLQCFAGGLLFGVGGLVTMLFNAIWLGAAFGYMATVGGDTDFFEFVTAHGPFELNAIVLSAAAGMRLGFSLVDTGGRSRSDSLRRAAREAVPTMAAAAILFIAAGFIEAWISPSTAPYWFKALVAVASASMLLIYFVLLGYPRGEHDESGRNAARDS